MTLPQEVRRRLRNMDRVHDQSEVLEVLKRFSQKILDNGCDPSSRKEILTSGIRKHYRDLAYAAKEGTSLYWTRSEINLNKDVKTPIPFNTSSR